MCSSGALCVCVSVFELCVCIQVDLCVCVCLGGVVCLCLGTVGWPSDRTAGVGGIGGAEHQQLGRRLPSMAAWQGR